MSDELDDYEDDYDLGEFGDGDRWECLYPAECLMPGEHLSSECHTIADMESLSLP